MIDQLRRIGIVGAGTMGSGIALTALYQEMPVTLHDTSVAVLDEARAYIETHLAKKGLRAALELLRLSTELTAVSEAHFVIEAVFEDLEVKKELFGWLDKLVQPDAILATNTSTLSVSAIGASTERPDRVVGMHFFNPAAVLPLVEVVKGTETTEDVVEEAVALASELGKTPVVTADTPGFIVNRVARPFYGEAIRMIGEGVADHTTIDRVVRVSGDFRMGPFQLIDLIGVDVNFLAMKSMYEQTFGEPRYRPHWLQAQMVAQNRLGRKTGHGFYDYGAGIPVTAPEPPGEVHAASGLVLTSSGSWAPGLHDRFKRAGYTLDALSQPDLEPIAGLVVAGRSEDALSIVERFDRILAPELPLLCQSVDITRAELAMLVSHPHRVIGFDGLFLHEGGPVTLTASDRLSERVRSAAVELIQNLGHRPVWIEDSPGMILPRIVCMLANEAAFAVMEKVAGADAIDQAMRLGVNYPKGPLAWARQLGLGRVVAVLDHLHREFAEPRYRVAPLLRRWARQTANRRAQDG